MILRREGLAAQGRLWDYRPTYALAQAVASFDPDRLVISTHPEDSSVWLGEGVVSKERRTYALPLTHVVAGRAREPEPLA